MVFITHLVVSLFLLVSIPIGGSSGFSIGSRDTTASSPPVKLASSLSDAVVVVKKSTSNSATERSSGGIDTTKTQQQIVLSAADHPEKVSASSAAKVTATPTAHHVPLDIAPESDKRTGSSSNPTSKTVSVVKREVSPTATEENDGKINGLYDPSLMIMSKRSAAALNKLMLALRSFDEPSSSSSYENSVEGSTKETSGRFPKVGFRTSSSGVQFDPFPQNGLQRRGQKDRKIYLRCYFNAVSCFRRRK